MRAHHGRTLLPRILTVFFLLLVGSAAFADQAVVERTIDLAQPLDADWSIPDGAKVTVKLIHKVPQQNYDPDYPKYTLNPSALDTANVFKPAAQTPANPPAALAPPVVPPGCTGLKPLIDNLINGTEKNVEANVRAINALLATTQGCPDEPRAQALVEETEEIIPISDIYPSIGADEGVLLTITRTTLAPGETALPPPWVLNIHPGIGNGKFLTNYTFAFALNRDKTYFANGTGDNAKIAEQIKRDKGTMIPMVLFSFLSRKKATTPGVLSWTAGLGYDLSNPVVGIGGIWTWNRNIGISFGLLGQKQQRLKGKYHIDDKIPANTESKDLTDATWGPNVFVGISIRSVSALFK